MCVVTGWHTVRHNRNEQWPVVAPTFLLEDALLQFQPEDCMESSESTATDILVCHLPLFTYLFTYYILLRRL